MTNLLFVTLFLALTGCTSISSINKIDIKKELSYGKGVIVLGCYPYKDSYGNECSFEITNVDNKKTRYINIDVKSHRVYERGISYSKVNPKYSLIPLDVGQYKINSIALEKYSDISPASAETSFVVIGGDISYIGTFMPFRAPNTPFEDNSPIIIKEVDLQYFNEKIQKEILRNIEIFDIKSPRKYYLSKNVFSKNIITNKENKDFHTEVYFTDSYDSMMQKLQIDNVKKSLANTDYKTYTKDVDLSEEQKLKRQKYGHCVGFTNYSICHK